LTKVIDREPDPAAKSVLYLILRPARSMTHGEGWMRRRNFISGLGVAVIPWPLAVRAEARTFRLGILVNRRSFGPDELLKVLHDLGYVEGQNLIVEWRYSEGVSERWLPLARELVALKVDAIVVLTTPAALAAKQATSTIPIVIPIAADPVGAGLAESLARPGGNVTGFAMMAPEISGKAFSLFKEAVPMLRRVAVLWNAANPANTGVWQSVDATAGSLGVALVSAPVREPKDFLAAFAAIAAQRPQGVFVFNDALVAQHMDENVDFLLRERLASASTVKEFPSVGGLMSYGPNIAALQRQAASYVDRIFKGERPATLPFQEPTVFELVINLKTAKDLELIIASEVLARADDLIE
jgi:putative tryptophan/tyrosine transport system substrate-binding protein